MVCLRVAHKYFFIININKKVDTLIGANKDVSNDNDDYIVVFVSFEDMNVCFTYEALVNELRLFLTGAQVVSSICLSMDTSMFLNIK
jgi:hypothetical protein